MAKTENDLGEIRVNAADYARTIQAESQARQHVGELQTRCSELEHERRVYANFIRQRFAAAGVSDEELALKAEALAVEDARKELAR